MTTIVPTAVAACAARGEGGSPTGLSLIHVRTVKKANTEEAYIQTWMDTRGKRIDYSKSCINTIAER